MKLNNLIKREVELCLTECNFTDDERAYFKAKASGESDVKIAMDLCISSATVTRLAKKVKTKVNKVLTLTDT